MKSAAKIAIKTIFSKHNSIFFFFTGWKRERTPNIQARNIRFFVTNEKYFSNRVHPYLFPPMDKILFPILNMEIETALCGFAIETTSVEGEPIVRLVSLVSLVGQVWVV